MLYAETMRLGTVEVRRYSAKGVPSGGHGEEMSEELLMEMIEGWDADAKPPS
jgi:hypothetical protein